MARISYMESSLNSCGTIGLSRFQRETPEQACQSLAKGFFTDRHSGHPRREAAFCVFSDFIRRGGSSKGHKIVDYLLENDLGTVWTCDKRRNPNSRNSIQIWIFAPNIRKFRAFAKKKKWIGQTRTHPSWLHRL